MSTESEILSIIRRKSWQSGIVENILTNVSLKNIPNFLYMIEKTHFIITRKIFINFWVNNFLNFDDLIFIFRIKERPYSIYNILKLTVEHKSLWHKMKDVASLENCGSVAYYDYMRFLMYKMRGDNWASFKEESVHWWIKKFSYHIERHNHKKIHKKYDKILNIDDICYYHIERIMSRKFQEYYAGIFLKGMKKIQGRNYPGDVWIIF